MGLQDRDYYREWWNNRERSNSPRSRIPAFFRRRSQRAPPPDLWGANFHWTIKLLVWLAIAVLILAAIRLLR